MAVRSTCQRYLLPSLPLSLCHLSNPSPELCRRLAISLPLPLPPHAVEKSR
uniref:Uncharacterized protein n=1 Tax=Setaria italica TaxID=4555 RepID=K3XU12_SETIT